METHKCQAKPLVWWEWLGIGLRPGVEEVFKFYESDLYSNMHYLYVYIFIENRPISVCKFFKETAVSRNYIDLLTGGSLKQSASHT